MPLRLTEADLKFLSETLAEGAANREHFAVLVREEEGFLDRMLEETVLVERLFNDEEALVSISPHLLFTILLRHVRRDIEKESYLYDYEIGARKQRIPVFAVPEVSGLLGENDAVDYLAGMLASFVRAHSVVHTWKDDNGRSHRDRFDDTDIDDMIELSRRLEPARRPRYYRRIGDIALFLSGIYPDHAAFYHFLTPRSARRVGRGRNLADYEREGRQFYRRAAEEGRSSRRSPILSTLSLNFSNARRALNVLSERYLRHDEGNFFFGSQESTS